MLWRITDQKTGLLLTPIKQPLLLNISMTEVFRITTSHLFHLKAVQLWGELDKSVKNDLKNIAKKTHEICQAFIKINNNQIIKKAVYPQGMVGAV